jgi:hypothetical protein
VNDDARHSRTGDRSFTVSLVTHLSAGLALVLVVAGAFWGLGQIQAPDGDPTPPEIVAGDEPGEPATPETPAETPDPEPEPTDEPADEEPDPATEEPEAPAAFAPGEISVQVRDAAGDGGARMRAVEQRLRADGYRVVATHTAIRIYERSTIFFTQGAEDKAHFMAGNYPEFTIVDEKPDNLSASVNVHVVVGQDYPAP